MKNLWALFCLSVLSATPAVAANYTITDLGTLGGVQSHAAAINASGQIAGWSEIAGSSNRHAFLYSNGAMADLGTLGGAHSQAYALNDAGHVTGFSWLSNSSIHAFLYQNSGMTDLGTLNNQPGLFYGDSINNNDQIIGHGLPYGAGGVVNFFYQNGTMTNWKATSACPACQAVAINGQEQITGSLTTGPGVSHAFVYDNGTISDLGTLPGGLTAIGTAINEVGQVVGVSSVSGLSFIFQHAFIYSQGTMKDIADLGVIGSVGGINDAGQVVGSMAVANSKHAFVYTNNATWDLNTLIATNSGWFLEEAADINNAGQITGTGMINGQRHAFILTPTSVPVPGSIWLLGTALAGLIGRQKRHVETGQDNTLSDSELT